MSTRTFRQNLGIASQFLHGERLDLQNQIDLVMANLDEILPDVLIARLLTRARGQTKTPELTTSDFIQ